MTLHPASALHRPAAPGVLVALILFQIVCTLFFVADVATDMQGRGLAVLTDWHLMPEIGATTGLFLGILFEIAVLVRLLRRQARLQQGMSVAAGALAEVMEGWFARSGTT